MRGKLEKTAAGYEATTNAQQNGINDWCGTAVLWAEPSSLRFINLKALQEVEVLVHIVFPFKAPVCKSYSRTTENRFPPPGC